jgi:predicted O-linked N-acetylglucosamine transferase (SPINDLY family)
LRRAFAKKRLDADRFCVFHPRLSTQDYLRLNMFCDVFLDSIHWSGNNTAHEAAACGLPIVTLPGPMMRGRHCLALLTMMGLTDTIASDIDDYVAIAVRLGANAALRLDLRAATLARRGLLFDDLAPVQGLEKFLLDATGGP